MLNSAITIGVLGLAFGILLAIASKKFYVKIDRRVEEVRNALPGANCGACGQPGCDGLANAIVKGYAIATDCPVGTAEGAKEIAQIMKVETPTVIKKHAVVLCNGSVGNTKDVYDYDGIRTCYAANIFSGGQKECYIACLGYGDCKKVCNFGAISIINEKAEIDFDKCTGCGKCVASCPKDVIELMETSSQVVVSCRNAFKAKDVKTVCSRGCIKCKICEKVCKFDAIKVGVSHAQVAEIDYSKCTSCGDCVEKCPTNCITLYGNIPQIVQ